MAESSVSPQTRGQSGIKRPSLQCPYCKETVSYSTYRRHQQTQSCVSVTPGNQEESNSESLDDFLIEGFQTDESDAVLDSIHSSHGCPGDSPPNTSISGEISPSVDDFNLSSSDESDDLAPEIWDSDSDSEGTPPVSATHSVKGLNYALSYFLLFSQLCYRLSDRGLEHIISLISSLLFWLTTIIQCSMAMILYCSCPPISPKYYTL